MSLGLKIAVAKKFRARESRGPHPYIPYVLCEPPYIFVWSREPHTFLYGTLTCYLICLMPQLNVQLAQHC